MLLGSVAKKFDFETVKSTYHALIYILFKVCNSLSGNIEQTA